LNNREVTAFQIRALGMLYHQSSRDSIRVKKSSGGIPQAIQVDRFHAHMEKPRFFGLSEFHQFNKIENLNIIASVM
jgi:hypothetical protein